MKKKNFSENFFKSYSFVTAVEGIFLLVTFNFETNICSFFKLLYSFFSGPGYMSIETKQIPEEARPFTY